MNLHETYRAAHDRVAQETHFVPFVGGEAERLERCAIAVRRVLGLGSSDVVDPHAAARQLGVPVLGEPQHFALLPDDVREAMLGSREWTAGTLEGPAGPLIISNPIHDPARLRVTLAEELSHLVMGHPPSSLDPSTGLRTYNRKVEDEAFGVGGAMVLPYGKLFTLVKAGRPLAEIAEAFGLSVPMARCRVNRTGLSRMHQKRLAA